MKKKLSLISAFLVMTIVTHNVQSAEIVQDGRLKCIELCKNALNAADAHIHQQEQIIKKQAVLNQFYEKELAKSRLALMEELERRQSWYNNPTITVTLGITAGLLTGVLVSQ